MLVVVGRRSSSAAPWRYLETHGGVAWVEDRVHDAASPTRETERDGNAAGRLISLNTGRPPLWREALDSRATSRVRGTGAGTFPFTHYRFRESGGVVKHAHSQWFNVLSELGVVGLGALRGGDGPASWPRRCGNPSPTAATRCTRCSWRCRRACVAFVVHISWDWDWDMAAVGTVVFVFIAVCVSYRSTRRADERRRERRAERRAARRPPRTAGARRRRAADPDDGSSRGRRGRRRRRRSAGAEEAPRRRARRVGWPPRVVASVALRAAGRELAAAVLRASAPRTRRSPPPATATWPRRSAHARRAARAGTRSRSSPLLTEATLLQQLGRNREALERLQAAAKLQPQNYEVWYELGVLLHGAFGRDKAARAAFTRALALNPLTTPRAATSSSCSPGSLAARRRRPGVKVGRAVVDFPRVDGALFSPAHGGTSRMDAAPIGVVGTGYVGLVSAVCFAHLGHRRRVHGRRRGQDRAAASGARSPSTSPASRSSSTTTPPGSRSRPPTTCCSSAASILFIAVDTPPSPSGDADLSRVQHAVARDRGARRASACSS